MFNKKSATLFLSSPLTIFSGSGLIIILDQAIKYKIRQSGGFYICNMGISFGTPVPPALFWLILGTFLMLGFLYIKHLQENNSLTPLTTFATSLILGGALANGLDRLFFNCVIDFFSLGWTFLPLFNLADIVISLGSFLLLLAVLTKREFISV